jgi:hypothetical protein
MESLGVYLFAGAFCLICVGFGQRPLVFCLGWDLNGTVPPRVIVYAA